MDEKFNKRFSSFCNSLDALADPDLHAFGFIKNFFISSVRKEHAEARGALQQIPDDDPDMIDYHKAGILSSGTSYSAIMAITVIGFSRISAELSNGASSGMRPILKQRVSSVIRFPSV